MKAEFYGMLPWKPASQIIECVPLDGFGPIDMHNAATLHRVSFSNTMRPTVTLEMTPDDGQRFSLAFEHCVNIGISFDRDIFKGQDAEIDYTEIETLDGVDYYEDSADGPPWFEIDLFAGSVRVQTNAVRFSWKAAD